jgi:hypothetical protein
MVAVDNPIAEVFAVICAKTVAVFVYAGLRALYCLFAAIHSIWMFSDNQVAITFEPLQCRSLDFVSVSFRVVAIACIMNNLAIPCIYSVMRVWN